jgi:hypothetical protein
MTTRVQVNNVVAEWDDKHVITTAAFWDCSCKDNYIHTCRQNKCLTCGDLRHTSPDSRIDEVIEYLIRLACEDRCNDITIRTVTRRSR